MASTTSRNAAAATARAKAKFCRKATATRRVLSFLKKENDTAADALTVEENGIEAPDLEMEFEVTMMPVLEECSRQKLRLFHMTLLKYGSNLNERVTTKDIVTAFQETNIKLPSRALQLISDVYEDGRGIDFQRMYRRLEHAQSKTRRDSVLARQLIGDRTFSNKVTAEARDLDLLKRIEEQLVKCPYYFDLEKYRAACLEEDTNKTGKLNIEKMRAIAHDQSLPVYGSLLTNLLNRCDDEKNSMASWPEFMNFLNKAMDNYSSRNPGKPRLGLDKPKRDQDAKSTAAQLADAKAKLESSRRVSVAQHNFLNLGVKSKERKKQLQQSETSQCAPDKKEDNSSENWTISQSDANIPTRSFNIGGKVVELVIPSDLNHSKEATIDPPKGRLKIDWVFGYNGKDTRRNVHTVKSGELLYTTGHVAVLLNFTSDEEQCKQRHYKEHTASITCICVHSDGVQIASAQATFMKAGAHIRLWNSDSLQTLSIFGDSQGVRSYTHLSFCFPKLGKALTSTNLSSQVDYKNQLLAGEQRDTSVSISVWDVGTKAKLADALLDTQRLCAAEFNPVSPGILVTLGKDHFQWWKLDRHSNTLTHHSEPNFGMQLKARYYHCLYHTADGTLITGDSNGTIYVWPPTTNSLSNLIKHAHQAAITAITVLNSCIITCGREGILKVWRYAYHLDQLLEVELPSGDKVVKSLLCYSKDILILGTDSNSIIQYYLTMDASGCPKHTKLIDQPLVQGVVGHVVSTINITSSKPPDSSDLFLVTSTSGYMALYRSNTRTCVSRFSLQGFVLTSVTIRNDEPSHICIGTQLGHVVWINILDGILRICSDVALSKGPISHVSYSPTGGKLAAVSKSTLYILAEYFSEDMQQETLVVRGKVKVTEHKERVTSMDWSQQVLDGTHIIRVYWDPIKLSCIRSIQPLHVCTWGSQSCHLSYPVAGVWCNKQCAQNGLHSIDVNKERQLIAVCDKLGYIYLFQYPCISAGAFCHTYKSHIKPGSLIFTSNDLLLTSGAADNCIIQWKII